MAARISLRRPYASFIYSISPLCMESNTLEKSSNKSVASRFFTSAPLMDSQILTIPQNFLNFMVDTIEKHSIINFNSYSS